MSFSDFRFAFRNLLRHRQHAFLNISGLGVAIAACIIIFLVVRFEYSHNKHLEKYIELYQIVTVEKDSQGEHFTTGVPFPCIKYFRLDFPELQFGQYHQNYGSQITIRNAKRNLTEGNKFLEGLGVYFADPELVDLMEIDFLIGNSKTLKGPEAVVISQEMAEKYFGNWREAIGQQINFDNSNFDLTITGVFQNQPDASDFPFEIIASYKAFENNKFGGWPLDSWGANTSNHQVFVHIPNPQNLEKIKAELAVFQKKYNKDNPNSGRKHLLLPISEVHFDERFGTAEGTQSSKSSLFTLSLIGFLILAMAGINFINLSTALSAGRSKEFGVRKVLGGSREKLMLQSFTETFLLVLVSSALGLILAWGLLPYVKHVLSVRVMLDIFKLENYIFLFLLCLLITFLAGFYPALVLSGFHPIEALRNKFQNSRVSRFSLRRVLVVSQFAFSQVFIICTAIAIKQMDFIQNSDLGFQKEAILMVSGGSGEKNLARFKFFKTQVLQRKDVTQASLCFDAPGSENSWQSNFAFDSQQDKDFGLSLKFGDSDYAKTYGLELKAGRWYADSDTAREFVVNETFLKKVGLKNPEDAIGMPLRLGGQSFKTICGVVKDFHAHSLREEIPPIMISPNAQHMGTLAMKLNSFNLKRSRDEIKEIWDHVFPEYVFDDRFLDESIQNFYKNEERISNMYKVYALLALFISSLGLYGLISYLVVQKNKEVGIRKILGASVQSIIFLFSKEFTILVLIAFFLAAPAGWYFMNLWLENFAFRIHPGPGVFVFSMIISIVVAWLTVGLKSWKAAISNPIKAIKTE
jgi:putative ABC transport system permease protein